MTQEVLLIIDFGSQYTQLIARRIREINVYSEIIPFNKQSDYDYSNIKGIILSGSPYSVNDNESPRIAFDKFPKVPILAVCYGAQLIAKVNGGDVKASKIREYGRANLNEIKKACNLFEDINIGSQVWMSHGDTIMSINDNYDIIASTESVKIAAYKHKEKDIYGIQFHPEVTHSTDGNILLSNFVKKICGFECNWTSVAFIENTVNELREKIQDNKVILGLSGGVDSSVAAVLLHKAIGKNLYCIFVNNGLLRKDEYTKVLASYLNMGLNVIGVDAEDKFINQLNGISSPEEKRKIIGKTFIEVFEEEALRIKDVSYLAQGTIYPDVIESISVNGPSATIKSHHNVGGLPEKMNLKIVEPLRYLFKDEVRRVGYSLNIDNLIISRHPFPGPGLAIRIIGDITKEKITLLQEADDIFIEGLKKHNLYDKVWQAGVMLLPIKSVGVMGDERTYENVVALRAVCSLDGMTADWVHLPYEFLAQMSNEIINKVKGINRVVYDISSKPPATIEWE